MRLDKKTGQEIASLFQTISDCENICDYLLSASYLQERSIDDPCRFWETRCEWAEAYLRLAGTFNICLPMLEYAEEKQDFFRDKRRDERKENARKRRDQLESSLI